MLWITREREIQIQLWGGREGWSQRKVSMVATGTVVLAWVLALEDCEDWRIEEVRSIAPRKTLYFIINNPAKQSSIFAVVTG